MSLNTFLVVFGRKSPHSFNKWLYSLACFGGPFVSGLTLFFISDPIRGPVYGATTVSICISLLCLREKFLCLTSD